jgi:Cytoplasmic polyadenylation element-binding protein ZZ domain
LSFLDKTKYPIGSGRITFNNFESHMKAIRAGTVEIRTAKFSRQIKIDPYLEDNVCSMCHNQMGPFFCRDLECFSYFCYQCWQWQHADGPFAGHQAMVRPARAASSEEDTP